MKLYEFFGLWHAKSPMDVDNPMDKNHDGVVSNEEREGFKNDLFFYILDHDDIHKKHFHEIAEKLGKDTKEDVWMPMVKRGCMEYYRAKQLRDDPKDLFSKEFTEELCQLLDDHFRKDITDGEYKR
jgi:hypothetical protein